jgi:hypothetical protein
MEMLKFAIFSDPEMPAALFWWGVAISLAAVWLLILYARTVSAQSGCARPSRRIAVHQNCGTFGLARGSNFQRQPRGQQ